MAELFAYMIKNGTWILEKVPTLWKSAVEEILSKENSE